MEKRALLLALLVSFLWALNTVVNKYCMKHHMDLKTVTVIVASTYFVCMLFFILYHYDELSKDIQKTESKYILLLIIVSIFGTFVSTILFTYLLEQYNSFMITSITYTSPLFVLILGYLFLNEKVDIINIIGIIPAVVGITLISL